MLNRTVKIPQWLHDIHGEEASPVCLMLTYIIGILYGAAFLVLLPIDLPIWKSILTFIILFDIGGGVISNLSTSTNQYYQKNERKRIVFLSLHILQPALMISVFPGECIYFIFVGAFTVTGSFIILFIKNIESQQVIASSLVSIGIFVSLFFIKEYFILNSFGILFMIKLLLGFSVKRPAFE